MAIVKTTTRDSEGGSKNGESVDLEKPIDRTKSVVNQGGRPTARPTRTPGLVNRPAPQQLGQQAGAKDFFRDTMAELKRVVWPPKEERSAGTIVTVGMLIFFALYIFGLDSLMRVVFIALGILPADSLR